MTGYLKSAALVGSVDETPVGHVIREIVETCFVILRMAHEAEGDCLLLQEQLKGQGIDVGSRLSRLLLLLKVLPVEPSLRGPLAQFQQLLLEAHLALSRLQCDVTSEAVDLNLIEALWLEVVADARRLLSRPMSC